MRTKTKRLFAAALAAVLAATATGCSNNSTGNKEFPTLTYYMFGTTSEVQDGMDAVSKKLNEMANEKIGVNLDLQILELGIFDQQMTVKLASNEKIDLMFTAPWLNSYSNLATRNALLELDELLPKYAPEYYKSIPEKWWDATRINGKIYAAINQQIFARQNTFVYLKEAVDKTGFDWENCDTLEELESFFKAAIDAGYNTKEYTLWEMKEIMTLCQQWGFETIGATDSPGVIKYDNPNGVKVFNQYESDEFKNFLKLVRSWNKKGYIANDALSTTASRTQIFKLNGCYKPGYTEIEEKQTFSNGADIYYKPVGESILTTGNVIATMTGVAKTSQYPEKAVEFINLMNTDKEFFNTACFGIEGTDYKKNEDGTVKPLDTAVYNMGAYAWAFGNQFNAYVQEGVPTDSWEQQDKFNHDSKESEILGFSFDETNVTNEVANCKAVITEYLNPLLYGFLDLDSKYPEFIEKMNAAGADKVMAEKQRQIDEFLANR